MKKLLSLLVAALMITASSCAIKDQPGAGPATDGTESALPETTDAAMSAPETTEPDTGEPATEAVTEAPAGLEEKLKQAYADLCYNMYYKDKDPDAVFDRDAVRVEIIYEKDGSVVFYGRGGEPFASTGDTVVKYCGGYIFCLPNQNTVRLYDNGTLLELFSAYEQGHITEEFLLDAYRALAKKYGDNEGVDGYLSTLDTSTAAGRIKKAWIESNKDLLDTDTAMNAEVEILYESDGAAAFFITGMAGADIPSYEVAGERYFLYGQSRYLLVYRDGAILHINTAYDTDIISGQFLEAVYSEYRAKNPSLYEDFDKEGAAALADSMDITYKEQ